MLQQLLSNHLKLTLHGIHSPELLHLLSPSLNSNSLLLVAIHLVSEWGLQLLNPNNHLNNSRTITFLEALATSPRVPHKRLLHNLRRVKRLAVTSSLLTR